MDPIQIPVPTAPVAPQMQPEVPQVTPTVPQDDFVDKILKGIVNFVAKLINKEDPKTPVIPLGAVPQPSFQIPSTESLGGENKAATTILENIGSTIGNVSSNVGSTIGTVGSAIGNIASQAVNIAQDGVHAVVQKAEDYIAEPTITQSSLDVQDFLSQNYQGVEESNHAQATPSVSPVSMPVENTIPTPSVTPQAPTPPVQS